MSKEKNEKVAINESKIGIESPMVISHIAKNCLYTGFFGRLDSVRIKAITDKIISKTEATSITNVILDLSNVEIIDSAICQHLLDIAKILEILGIEVIFCGIKSVVAQSMTNAGIDLARFVVKRNLEIALTVVYEKMGYRLMKISD